MKTDEFTAIVRDLRALPHETEWVEFKHNNADPQEIGANLSAISNSAALHGKPMGYIVWGIANDSHEVVGTTFKPGKVKKGMKTWRAGCLVSCIPGSM